MKLIALYRTWSFVATLLLSVLLGCTAIMQPEPTPEPGAESFEEVAFGLQMGGMTLVRIEGDNPAMTMPVTGLNAGTSLLALDFRPSNSLLYALGSDGQLYTLDADGRANPVGSPQAYNGADLSQGVAFDVNAQVDAIRVITSADGRNFVTNPTTGVPAEFTVSTFAAGDSHEGVTPLVLATAYDINVAPFPDGQTTTQYSIEAARGVLAIQGKNNGDLSTVASLDVTVGDRAGFDISGDTDLAYVLLPGTTGQVLYRIDLASAELTPLTARVADLIDLTIVPGGSPEAAPELSERAYGLSEDGMTLIGLGEAVGENAQIAGLNPGTQLLALDYRPAAQTIYALGSDGQLYTLMADGAASAVGTPQSYEGADLSGGVAFDINPQVDAIRVITTADGRNFVTNPATGVPAEFTGSAYAEDDENAGITPSVLATAYDMNVAPFPDDAETVQYSLEAEANTLAIQGKNAGTLLTVAELALDIGPMGGLDISGETGMMYALVTIGGSQALFIIDPDNGLFTRLRDNVTGLRDFTIVP